MAIKKTVRGHIPGVHPGLMEKIRDAESAEIEGRMPHQINDAQKVLRATIDPSTIEQGNRAKALGLIDPAERIGANTKALLAKQSPFRPGENLDEIWDELSEKDKVRAGGLERFRLEIETTLEESQVPWQPQHKIGGRLDARNIERSKKNLKQEISAYKEVLAKDSLTLLNRFIDETCELIALCLRHQAVAGLNALPMYEILQDWLQKLIYQELVNRVRKMGDRGIRPICGAIDLAEELYEQFRKFHQTSPRERLLMRMILVHRYLGFTAYAARMSYRGTRMHRAYSARLLNDELNKHRALFPFMELEIAKEAIATHSAAELPFSENLEDRTLAVIRTVSHLTPLAGHKVYLHLREITGVKDYLDRMLSLTLEGKFTEAAEVKPALHHFLLETKMEPNLAADIMADFRPHDKLAAFIDLGKCAGEITALTYSPATHTNTPENTGSYTQGLISVQFIKDPFSQKYQSLFDHQQDQFIRMTKKGGILQKDIQNISPNATVTIIMAEGASITLIPLRY